MKPGPAVVLQHADLTLRCPDRGDVAGVVAAVTRSRAELEPWLPWATNNYGVASAQGWVDGEVDGFHRFAMIVDGEFAGACGLSKVDTLNRSANLGYWVRSDLAGRGLATAATRLLARYGAEHTDLHRLEVIMSVHNEASRRVAEKAGASYEGVSREAMLLHGVYHDTHVFSFVPGDQARLRE